MLGLRLKKLALVWLAVYVLVTGMLMVFDAMAPGVALPLRTLIMTAAMVPVLDLVIVPIVLRLISPPKR